MGLSGPGQRGPGVPLLLYPVNDCRSVVEVGSSRAAVELLSLSRRCRVLPPYRPRVIGFEETGMMTARPWWRILVGGEAWWWCSIAAEFFCGLGREKSMLACLTLTRCRF
jgi:hypothetical protein